MASATDNPGDDPEAFVGYPETRAFLPFRKRYLAGKPVVEKVEFHGTVKIHGCNISVIFSGPKTWQIQSRNRVLSVKEDQYDICAKLNDAPWDTLAKEILQILDALNLEQHEAEKEGKGSNASKRDIQEKLSEVPIATETIPAEQTAEPGKPASWEDIMIVGEWAGKGIQKGVGVCDLDRFFTIFNIRIGQNWQDIRKYKSISLPSHRIFNICDFPTYILTIDLADLKDVDRAEKELEKMVGRIDKECPVAAHFGVKGTGEGLVFTYHPLEPTNILHHFKVKGQSHVIVKNERVERIPNEKVARIGAFVEYAVTEARLDQGLEYLKEMLIPVEAESTGKYIKWVVQDVLKEESDKLEDMDLKETDIKFRLTKAVRLGWTTRLREVQRL